MEGLAEEFLDHCKQWNVEPALVQQVLGSTLDVEHLIEELDHICSARASLETIGQEAGSLERFDKIRAEIEWFIQHAAERIHARDAHLMWGSVLRASARVTLTLATTNYDRAIELAANAEGIDLDDGFGQFDQREIAAWTGFGRSGAAVSLVKLHGSTDWYADGVSGSPRKLRHPMPLFGRATLRLPDGSELGSALILPSREKLLTRDPYPRLSQVFLNAADSCDMAVVIGSSLRDHHLRSAAQAIAQRVPMFIVNPEGSTHQIGHACAIPQSASTLLISTLPAALIGREPQAALRDAASLPVEQRGNSLIALKNALDPEAPTPARCRALEELDAQGASLDSELMRELLECTDPHVARYALGLIPLSPDRAKLMDMASAVRHSEDDAAYLEDLSLLNKLLSV